MKLFSLPAFFIGFIVGLVIINFHTLKKHIIRIYPTLENKDKVLYQDDTDQCFSMIANEGSCDDQHVSIPVQLM
jgi:hypothetical protein